MAVRIQFRRGTSSAWTSANPTLATGEFGYETDTGKFKIGDNTTAWASLPYAASGLTGVTAGTGLTGGGTTGTVTVSLDTTAVIQPTIVDAKGDLIVATAADAVARLASGTANQRLVVDTSTATGLKWVSDTQQTVIDAKGDLVVGTTADTVGRLPVGTNGYVLTADSAETTGVKWAEIVDTTTPDDANLVIGFSCFL